MKKIFILNAITLFFSLTTFASDKLIENVCDTTKRTRVSVPLHNFRTDLITVQKQEMFVDDELRINSTIDLIVKIKLDDIISYYKNELKTSSLINFTNASGCYDSNQFQFSCDDKINKKKVTFNHFLKEMTWENEITEKKYFSQSIRFYKHSDTSTLVVIKSRIKHGVEYYDQQKIYRDRLFTNHINYLLKSLHFSILLLSNPSAKYEDIL